MKTRLPAALATTIALATAASAHPGGLDAQGCHHNRKTGGYPNSPWQRLCVAARSCCMPPHRRLTWPSS
ncbi:YHYH domain-containing protein [Pelomonas sp. P7]|uniref:YHYH domain-containing protein n=1 Tax=Pelomonas caseinilytica TaxID=2906763 RepID=A0ABS8XC85_9BURK|nr:YHYH domain-containing protein [Pelomonas sp. P7]MCE4538549.1 YHYH domain-containing protein [Pelomonas sp. P7]